MFFIFSFILDKLKTSTFIKNHNFDNLSSKVDIFEDHYLLSWAI